MIDWANERGYPAPRTLDEFINIFLLVLLCGACFVILRPFLLLIDAIGALLFADF